MSRMHRPWHTKHGTHCSCEVFCGSDRESWESHAIDVLVLYPEDRVDYRALNAIEIAFRPFVRAYLESAKRVAKQLENLTIGLSAASDFKRTMDKVESQMKPGDLVIPPSVYEMADQELPGMWTKADFEGGDPDERSYAQRCRDGDHVLTNFKDNDHTSCVNCGRCSRHQWRDFRTVDGIETKCVRCGTRD